MLKSGSCCRAIGAGRAAAIVAYRSKLGGFTSVKQLLEINSIVDSVLKNQSLCTCNIKPIQKKTSIPMMPTASDIHIYQQQSGNYNCKLQKMHGDYKSTEQLHLDLKKK